MKNDDRNHHDNVDFEDEEAEDELEEELLPGDPSSIQPEGMDETPIAHIEGHWEQDEKYPLSDDTVSDFIMVGTNPDSVMDEMEQNSMDVDVLDDFEERQNLPTHSDALIEDLREHTHQSPKLSGGDIDAAWEFTDQSGEESVGASVPTPDQDVVDELGEALGITYKDDEELDTAEKLGERDVNRWELNPASAQETEVERLDRRVKDPLVLFDKDEYAEIEPQEDELDELEELLNDDLDELEDDLQNEDMDLLDDEDLDDFDEEDLALLDDGDFDELDDEEDL